MFNVLVVEDSLTVRKVLFKLLRDNPYFSCVLCEDYAQAKLQLAKEDKYLAAIVDLNLPDAPNGEVVDLVLGKGIPTVVLSGNFDENLRQKLIEKGVVDYITKESQYSYMQVVKLIDRLRKNLKTKVLVVDDSKATNAYLCQFLKRFRFQVMAAFDGLEALELLKTHPDVKLVISDYLMPNMDGFELVRAIRQIRSLQDIVFIGLSSSGNSALTAKFIKSGANDFLSKPFYHEEFLCRVLKNIESQEMLITIRELAHRDPLTKAYNRRYLYEQGETLFRKFGAQGKLSVVMIDLDNFKSVNDRYGHSVGDSLLIEVVEILKSNFKQETVARYGGEEFTLLSTRPYSELVNDINHFMDVFRATQFTEHNLVKTCSVGVCNDPLSSFEKLIERSDQRLYKAKNTGKNKVIGITGEV